MDLQDLLEVAQTETLSSYCAVVRGRAIDVGEIRLTGAAGEVR